MATQIEIESSGYRLVAYIGCGDPDWPFFIYNADGEGASLSDKDIADILEKAFKEHFS